MAFRGFVTAATFTIWSQNHSLLLLKLPTLVQALLMLLYHNFGAVCTYAGLWLLDGLNWTQQRQTIQWLPFLKGSCVSEEISLDLFDPEVPEVWAEWGISLLSVTPGALSTNKRSQWRKEMQVWSCAKSFKLGSDDPLKCWFWECPHSLDTNEE